MRRIALIALLLLLPIIAFTRLEGGFPNYKQTSEPGMEGIGQDAFLCLVFEKDDQVLPIADVQISLYTKEGGEYQPLRYPRRIYADGYAKSLDGDHVYIFFPTPEMLKADYVSRIYISINGGRKNLLEMDFYEPDIPEKKTVLLNGANIWQEPKPRLEHIRLQVQADGTLVHEQ